MQELKQIISLLINQKNEGVYWDFKETSHNNKADLLHDIICLANANYVGDRYLIIGVSDPASGCEIKGIDSENTNRKNQAQLIDFLRSKDFAGNLRPKVLVHTMQFEEKCIDVIQIKNETNKPFYITDQYRDQGRIVEAYHIYSRTGDSNTPINESSDLPDVERMWKERFNLLDPPSVKIGNLLMETDKWEIDIGNKSYAYHKIFPEYNLEFLEPQGFSEVYCYYFSNVRAFSGIVRLKYHNTILFEHHYLYLDETRICCSMPEVFNPKISSTDYSLFYYYYNLETISGKLQLLLSSGDMHFISRGSSVPFLVFDDELKKEAFDDYLLEHEDKVNELQPRPSDKLAKYKIETAGDSFTIDPLQLGKVKQMKEEFDNEYFY